MLEALEALGDLVLELFIGKVDYFVPDALVDIDLHLLGSEHAVDCHQHLGRFGDGAPVGLLEEHNLAVAVLLGRAEFVGPVAFDVEVVFTALSNLALLDHHDTLVVQNFLAGRAQALPDAFERRHHGDAESVGDLLGFGAGIPLQLRAKRDGLLGHHLAHLAFREIVLLALVPAPLREGRALAGALVLVIFPDHFLNPDLLDHAAVCSSSRIMPASESPDISSLSSPAGSQASQLWWNFTG